MYLRLDLIVVDREYAGPKTYVLDHYMLVDPETGKLRNLEVLAMNGYMEQKARDYAAKHGVRLLVEPGRLELNKGKAWSLKQKY